MFSSEVLPAPLGPMIDRMLPRGTSSETSCDGGDAAELLRHAFDHELVVALGAQRRAGRRPRHDPSLLKVLFYFSLRGIMQAPMGEGNKSA